MQVIKSFQVKKDKFSYMVVQKKKKKECVYSLFLNQIKESNDAVTFGTMLRWKSRAGLI